ncbi:MAG: mandelate racemase [Deltaproteobacteria bacterium]|nr:mandelate racemase [Deltaproteobacteria bacterium]MBW1960124.1 mandelate racemase [Deltaproteobacteria bacterium]MBW1995945.1 mandelate racemase [Deltaproteobacteria bacterium]MBW2151372.1 mandelate racemase [Deltaproteobacteria bacterium]
MKITDLSVTMINWKSEPWKAAGMTFGGHRLLGIVTVQTDEGIEGHAFLGSSRQGADAFVGPLLEFIKPFIIGKNPLDIGAIWHRIWKMNRSVSTNAIGAVDVALWDVAGKVAGLPIHRLLGTCRDRVPAYASSGWLQTPEQYAEEAVYFKSLGWSAYKIHPHGNPKADIEICRTVREAVGDEMILMLDSMWAYGYEDALRVGRAIEALDYFWYEDPLAEEDIYNYIKLKDKLDIPILSTEYAPGRLYAMAQWIQQMATDMLRGDVAVSGGITPLVKIAHLAEAFRMKCEIHHGGNSLNNVANLHVTMATDNCDYYEVFPSHGTNKFGLVTDIEVDERGFVHAPENPGLGYDIDWKLVEREKVEVLR